MKWILIFAFYVGSNGGMSTGTAEFNSKSACDTAGKLLQEQIVIRATFYICTPKGTDRE